MQSPPKDEISLAMTLYTGFLPEAVTQESDWKKKAPHHFFAEEMWVEKSLSAKRKRFDRPRSKRALRYRGRGIPVNIIAPTWSPLKEVVN